MTPKHYDRTNPDIHIKKGPLRGQRGGEGSEIRGHDPKNSTLLTPPSLRRIVIKKTFITFQTFFV